MAGRIYSLGYEGLTIEGLLDQLTGARVSTLIDVRLTPVSRKPGFSKNKLAAALAEAGIEYLHEKQLGNPPENRDSFRIGDGAAGRQRMRQILMNGAGEALDRVVELASTDRVAVLCVEREHERCHRDVITQMAVERNSEIEVLHLL